MPTRNLVLFMVLSLGLLLGWAQLQQLIWKAPEKQPVPTSEAVKKGWSDKEGRELALDVVAHLAKELAPPPPPPPTEKIEPEGPPIILGGDGFYIEAEFTARGAAVQRLTLNEFKAADKYGKLAEKQPLELIPYAGRGSFALYHYDPKDDAKEPRPLDTLGLRMWTVVEGSVRKEGEEQQVAFTRDLPELGVRLTKTFTLRKRDYHIGLKVKVENIQTDSQAIKFRYQLAGALNLPIEGEWYTTTFRNALVGWVDPRGRVWRHLEDSRQIAHMDGGNQIRRADNTIRYAAVAVQYFASAIVVDKEGQPTGKDNFIEWVRATVGVHRHPADRSYLDDITVRATTEELQIGGGQSVEHHYLLYNGPVKVRLLDLLEGDRKVDAGLVERYENTLSLNTLTDYHSPGWAGSFADKIFLTDLIIWFTNRMHGLLWLLHQVVPIYGICIILLTVIVRGVMVPISLRQAKNSMEMQTKMQKLAPDLKKIKEKYKDDFTALSQAQQELYRRHGVNPFSTLGGCLLLFAQMPVFLGLYYALQESIFLRLDRFLWIPNLAAPDMLIPWGENIPMLTDASGQGGFFYLGPFFNLLPVLAVGLMMVQQKYMSPPAMDEQQASAQKMMKFMMIFFGLMFYKVAAGLCIYFTASSLWGLAERRFLPKPKPANGPDGTAATGAKPRVEEKKNADTANGTGVWSKMKSWWGDVLDQAAKDPTTRRDDSRPPSNRDGEDRPPKKKKKRN